MLTTRFYRKAALPVVAALVFGLAACDSATTTEETASVAEATSEDLAAVVVADLGLSAAQQATVSSFATKHGGATVEPGFSWRLAAQLQATLTEEQKQRLFERVAASIRERVRTGEGNGGASFGMHSRHRQGGQRGGGPGGGFLEGILTEEQRQQVEAIRATYREQIKAIRDGVDSGELTREQAREQVQAIHEAMRGEIDALLTEEQRQQIEAMRAEERQAEREARREQARDVRNEVLGLTDEEAAAFDAIMEAFREAASALREEMIAAGATRDEIHAAVQELKDQREAELEALLDDVQFEIVQLHEAVRHRMRHHRAVGGGGAFHRGGPGGTIGGFGSRG